MTEFITLAERTATNQGLKPEGVWMAVMTASMARIHPDEFPISWHKRAMDLCWYSMLAEESGEVKDMFHGMQIGAHIAKESLILEGAQNV